MDKTMASTLPLTLNKVTHSLNYNYQLNVWTLQVNKLTNQKFPNYFSQRIKCHFSKNSFVYFFCRLYNFGKEWALLTYYRQFNILEYT